MMGFTDTQVKSLGAKLNAKYVRARQKDGKTLSYVEGWHVISEANRIFGFEGWDRETMETRCVWEGTRRNMKACSYVARVRLRVRAGETIVVREGSGSGQGTAANPGDAHESAIKEAETDATKRALSTFGNPFGLALYDKDKQGVRQSRSSASGRPVSWVVLDAKGEPLSKHKDPVIFCSAARKLLESLDDAEVLMAFWKRNQDTVAQLRQSLPELKSEKGQHYGEILSGLYTARLQEFATRVSKEVGNSKQKPAKSGGRASSKAVLEEKQVSKLGPAKKEKIETVPFQKGPRRIRDKEHLEFITSRNCVICGRCPSQAHHIRYAQLRALSRKVSDEWTIPLCAIHHRALHDVGECLTSAPMEQISGIA